MAVQAAEAHRGCVRLPGSKNHITVRISTCLPPQPVSHPSVRPPTRPSPLVPSRCPDLPWPVPGPPPHRSEQLLRSIPSLQSPFICKVVLYGKPRQRSYESRLPAWARGRWTCVCLTSPSVTLLTSEAQCPHLKIGDNNCVASLRPWEDYSTQFEYV